MRLVTIKEKELNPDDFNDMLELTGYTLGLANCFIVLGSMIVFLFITSMLIVLWRNKDYS